ncbi:hypothetical protein HOLleu_19927 [Holothuria leucospilota]|uniref:Uncharacterized protein n=1 Tax=Holothuria leucospilota TaxID=206669 RepID=A0A9Q1H8A6_HOLLE|nr:hypothetical protein HOLleu_19927 [Holothuria leucospilota]
MASDALSIYEIKLWNVKTLQDFLRNGGSKFPGEKRNLSRLCLRPSRCQIQQVQIVIPRNAKATANCYRFRVENCLIQRVFKTGCPRKMVLLRGLRLRR